MNTKTIFTICLLLFGAMAVQAQGKSDLNKGAKAFKTKNYTEALEWYKKAAEKGNADAMNRIGVLYSGYLEPQDKEEAFKWFLKAAEGGNLNGITHVAGAYDRGSGVAQNPEEALKWYKIAADKGDHHSKYKVKEITATLVADAKKQTAQGIAAPTKPNNPISSPQANTVSTTNTAIKTTSTTTTSDPCGIPEYGIGFNAYIQKNFVEALKWFKIAAEKSCEKAAAKLGAMYHAGLGVSKNETEGFKWYKLAAEGGDLESKYMVGLSYIAGIGVQQNYPEARKWLKEAAKEGYPKSPETLWELDRKAVPFLFLSPSQLHDWEGSNGKLGYKDKASGSVWIPAKYEDGGLISEVEQLAPAKLNGKWGFIDLYDKTVIPFQYEDAEPLSFIEGLAAVKQNGKWGFIDKTGKVMIPFQYDKIELGCFVNGYAKVIKNGESLFIDKTGKEVK